MCEKINSFKCTLDRGLKWTEDRNQTPVGERDEEKENEEEEEKEKKRGEEEGGWRGGGERGERGGGGQKPGKRSKPVSIGGVRFRLLNPYRAFSLHNNSNYFYSMNNIQYKTIYFHRTCLI